MIEPTDEMVQAFTRHFFTCFRDADVREALAAVLAIVEKDRNDGLDLIDVVPSPTRNCLSLQCTGCGWTRHIAPGHPGGRALAHIVDLAVAHAREVVHG